MEEYYTETRDIAPKKENIDLDMEKKVILAFNFLNSEGSNFKEGETTSKKSFLWRGGLENLRKGVGEMGMIEFSFWIVNTILLFLIVLKEFFLI